MAASEDDAGSQQCQSHDHDDPEGDQSLENGSDASQCAEERIRVDRRKLEILLQAGLKEGQNNSESGEEFFQKIQSASNTVISWPSRLKIGAKSKKDPHIKVAGLPADIKTAKQMILSVLDVKTSRVTLKMDVSFTDHSHIIGRGGNCIKRVMQETGCHIHFPDSNRTSSEKSNQVSIAGHPHGVEAARKQIRELLPIVLMFEVPQNCLAVPDSTSTAIQSIAQKYNVSITFKQRPRAYGFIGTVRGLHSDPIAVRDAVLTLLEHLTGTLPVTVPVTTQIEIDCKHHTFIIGRNGSNIKQIMQHTGASIQFPDQNGIQGKKSTVFITGPIESAITAKIQLMEFLPLVLMFEVKDDEDDLVSDTRLINKLIEELDVLINVKSKPRQGTKSIIVKGIEKNAHNMHLTRCTLVKEDFSLAPMISVPLPAPPMKLVNPYFYSPRIGIPMPGNEFPTALLAPAMNGKLQIPYSVNTNNNEIITSSPLGSPLQSNSTSPNSVSQNGPPLKLTVNPVVSQYNQSKSPNSQASGELQKRTEIPISVTSDKLISSDLVRTMSVDSCSSTTTTIMMVGIKGSNSTGHLSRMNGEASSPTVRNESLEKSGGPEKLSALRKPNNGPFTDALSKRRFISDTKEKIQMPVGSRFSPTAGQESSHSLALNGSWNRSRPTIEVLGGVRNAPFSGNDSISPDPVLSDSQSELSMSGSLSQTSNLIDRLPFRKKKYNIADYELKRQMASKAMTNETDYEEVRMPTGTWSGFGFSKSMPESTLKDLWLKTNKSQTSKYSLVENFQHSPSQSLNSSASSNESNHSNASSSSCSSFSGPENMSLRRTQNSGPPPGLEGKPGMENAALLLNNNSTFDFTHVLSNESSLGTLAAVTDLCDLFSRIGLGKYSHVFVEQEVDLNTFMHLTDQDLREIGVSTFGARRRMILAIQDLKKIHGQRDLSSPSTVTKTTLPQALGQRCVPLDLASSSLRW
ncbi:protein bicaudal C homolog 1-like [Rhopilema esculentum]|uniref:protein bicaudal C homolog 1-like n=1 Tax=Rhopilema esculentum TaxID=499914 RepID=UPI0031CDE163